jgi:SAM-dependent methyltransferase
MAEDNLNNQHNGLPPMAVDNLDNQHNGLPPDILAFIASNAGSSALQAPQEDQDGLQAVNMMKQVNKESSEDMVELAHTLSNLTGAAVLELGPGQGFATQALLKFHPQSITAVELSPLFRKILARESTTKAAIDSKILTIVEDDAVSLPLSNNSIDIVLGMNVVYFLHPLETYLKEIQRVLKPGGYLIFGTKQGGAKLGTADTFVNTDNNVILASMVAVGFVDCEIGAARLLTNPLTPPMYVPVVGRK